MRMRALPFTVVFAAAFAMSAGGASAATLFTGADHLHRVLTDTTINATSAGPFILTAAPGTLANSCLHSTLHLKVSENDMEAGVGLTVLGGTFSNCNRGTTGTFDWKITITGTGTVMGPSTAYRATVDALSLDVAELGLFRGNLTTGVTATQPTVGTAPVCIHLAAPFESRANHGPA